MHRKGSERELSVHLSELIVSFSRLAAEAADLENADITMKSLCLSLTMIYRRSELGSFQALVEYHNNRQKDTGLKVERIREYLSADPNYDKIRDLVDKWVVIDTAKDFKPSNSSHSQVQKPTDAHVNNA